MNLAQLQAWAIGHKAVLAGGGGAVGLALYMRHRSASQTAAATNAAVTVPAQLAPSPANPATADTSAYDIYNQLNDQLQSWEDGIAAQINGLTTTGGNAAPTPTGTQPAPTPAPVLIPVGQAPLPSPAPPSPQPPNTNTPPALPSWAPSGSKIMQALWGWYVSVPAGSRQYPGGLYTLGGSEFAPMGATPTAAKPSGA